MIIRDEKNADIETIYTLTKVVFKDCPHGDHTEQFIVNALRDSFH